MNADLASATSSALVSRAADRVQRSGAGTRALYLVTSALTGAVLYMVVAWPGAHPTVQRAALPQSTLEAVPPSPQPFAARIEPSGSIGGAAVIEAVRAVGAASQVLIVARSSQSATALPPGAEAPNPAPADVRAPTARAASVVRVPSATTISATGAATVAAAGSVEGQNPRGTGLGGVSVDTRQPPAPQGPNRIAVPGAPAPLPPAGAPSSAAPASPSGSNRITVPVTQPPH